MSPDLQGWHCVTEEQHRHLYIQLTCFVDRSRSLLLIPSLSIAFGVLLRTAVAYLINAETGWEGASTDLQHLVLISILLLYSTFTIICKNSPHPYFFFCTPKSSNSHMLFGHLISTGWQETSFSVLQGLWPIFGVDNVSRNITKHSFWHT